MAIVLNRSRWMLALVFGGCLLALSVIDAQTTTAPPAAVTSQVSADQVATAMALLDRIDRLVSGARKDLDSDDLAPVGTAGRAGTSGKVTIRAADLDEIRAEITQIRLLLNSQPVASQKSEVRSQKSEVRSQKYEVRQTSDFRLWTSDFGKRRVQAALK